MDFLPAIPGAVLLALALCAMALVVAAAASLFGFFFKVGVAVHEARKPPHLDSGNYRLDQGREIRPEQETSPTRSDR